MWEILPAIISVTIASPKCGATYTSDILKEKYPDDRWAQCVSYALDAVGASEEEMEEVANNLD